MKDPYVIQVKTDKNLGAQEFVSTLLPSWVHRLDERLRPQYFGSGEPVRRSFEREGVDRAVKLWLDDQMPVMLRRATKPKLVADIKWRPLKGKDARPYPWGCTVWLDRSAGDELVLELFRFLIGHFEPAFGSVTTDADWRSKHLVSWDDRGGRAEQFMGLDVGRFITITKDYGRDVLPGVYWLTYFGRGAIAITGRSSLEQLHAHRAEHLADGYLVWAYPSASQAGSSLAAESEHAIKRQVGPEHFFDASQVNTDPLKTDEVTTARIGKLTNQIKCARR